MKNLLKFGAFLFGAAFVLSSCGGGERSATTGWKYNDTKWGGFEKLDYEGQATGPNLVLIEGGTFTMGVTQQDVTYEWNNIPRRVTVSSFYMDETEVSNIDYREYLYWLNRVFGESYPEVYRNALPDTLVWREELAFNEPFVETYFRHPSYDNYPVVGVSWTQATEYCKWRTDRANEMILIERGILNINPEQKDEDNFNTDAYLVGQYQGDVRKNLKDLRTGGERQVRFEDGIVLPDYRLPTEAEWEYAALALQGNQTSEKDERISDRRFYPWDGNTMRYQKRDKSQGMMLANFKRGAGDYMGMAGNLNDDAHITAPVREFLPNDFGLYNMAGNVNEWVLDLYRPLTSVALEDSENHDLNSYRGGEFTQLELDEDGRPVEKDSLGRLRYRYVTDEEAATRDNYKTGKVYNYLDGDKQSNAFYDTGVHTLVSDKTRVYKGGSWADRAYWLTPGTRRYLDQDKASRTIGFRCAMTRTGSPSGNDDVGGNQFSTKRKRKSSRRY
ncbi:SUMF1/EgtB/PvdO family nonheme iron enzyme [Phaeodactylibacter luteus]|uniref:SUMF1/EgtB/PvdOfamily nonheme iron enzyme n=1 Tax=Phaeodactylibacter luteus TaxID=1564516 RepID=A0A5C6RIL3_9BACT|nr:SUMF1/EgtB/PvdO family nonheme iron enzyme [Phaeodactylibacter luteus]TXB61510.1 SUMF1/EgtB/PvdOfamily nonheme iron enzyme [Phaeodactylibacter luteus]